MVAAALRSLVDDEAVADVNACVVGAAAVAAADWDDDDDAAGVASFAADASCLNQQASPRAQQPIGSRAKEGKFQVRG